MAVLALYGPKLKKSSIYVLIDPRDGQVRYVGKTCQQLSYRLHGHIKDARAGCETRRSRWLRGCLDAEQRPVIEAVEVCGDDWAERERYWISVYRRAGARLTNLTDGGEGAPGYVRSPELRAAAAIKASAISEETRAKRSKALTGRTYSPATLVKMSASAKKRVRRPCAPDTKVKIASGRMGNQWARGTKHTEQSRANMAAAQRLAVWGRKSTGRIAYAVVERVRELRMTGLSHQAIGLEVGISRGSVTNILAGKHASARSTDQEPCGDRAAIRP